METVILGDRVVTDIDAFLERRRALGQDRHDEVWEGVYHVAPDPHPDHGIVQVELMLVLAPLAKRAGLKASAGSNIGPAYRDFRVPDGSFFASRPESRYVTDAVVVIEVLSPGDETWEKLPFYAEQGVREILVAHPQERWVRCYDLQAPGHPAIDGSQVLGIQMSDVIAQVDWP